MGGLFKSRANNTTPAATTLRTQSSIQGRAIAIGAGRNRLAGNVVDWLNFTSSAAKSPGGKGGGGGGGKGQGGQYNYSVTGIVSICQGPITAIETIYNGNAVDFLNTPSPSVLADLAKLNIKPTYGNGTYHGVYFMGDYVQTPWSYLTTNFPSHADAYRGETLAAFANLPLGNSPTFPNFTFEITWGLNTSIPALGPDVTPSSWILKYLTDADMGVGFPATLLDSLADYSNYSIATSMVISPVLSQQAEGAAHLMEIMKATGCDFFWSQGKLKIAPYIDQIVSGNGVTYTPIALSPIYDLGLNDFLSNSSGSTDSPVTVVRKDSTTIINKVQLEYLDRSNLYNPVTIYATNDASIIESGRTRISDLRSHHFFCLRVAASTSVALQLAREQVTTVYQFVLPPQFMLLDPMDVVTITEPNLGLLRQAVRITEIQEDASRNLTFTAEEVPLSLGAPVYARQDSLGTGRNENIDPGQINPPIIFEPTDQLCGGLQVWGAVSGVDPTVWGGCYVWASYTEAGTYQQIGEIFGSARQGILTSILPIYAKNVNGATIDQTNTLAVDLTQSQGALSSGSPSDFTSLNTACYVDGEIVSYQIAALTAAYMYNLTPLIRGAYGSTIGAHALGSKFTRLDTSIIKIPFTPDRIGATLYLKFQSFNIYGGGTQNLSDVGAIPYVITGSALASPLPNITNVRTVFEAGFMKLYWDEITDFRSGILYQISQGPTFGSSLQIAIVAHPGYIVFGNGTFWITATCQPAAGLIVQSGSPQSITIAGNVLQANVIVVSDQQANGWLGIFQNTAKSGASINSAFSGNVLAISDFLNVPDLLRYGPIATAGTYTIPVTDIVDVGYSANCYVNVTWQGSGSPYNQNILGVTDILGTADILGAASSAFVQVYPQIQVDPGTGVFGSWVKFVPGVYTGRRFNFQLVLVTADPYTQANALAFAFSVQVPTRLDHYQNQSISAAGSTITFQPDKAASSAAFNGGPNLNNLPYINTSWSQVAGDTVQISGLTKSSVFIQFFNGGVGVAKTGVNIDAEGY